MRLARTFTTLLAAVVASATILENGQVRENAYPGQLQPVTLDDSWRNYPADAPEISYKGRWDSQHISWWSAPGIKVEFSGEKLAVHFGPSTNTGVLVAYRIGSLDWQFSNITASSTYQFVDESHKLGHWIIQIAGVAVANDAVLTKAPTFPKRVEIIGGSLASGQFATYETISSWSFLFANGLGNVEYGITAYPGVCLADEQCYNGGSRGVGWYWHRASDPGSRARSIYDRNPEKWDVKAEQPADLVIIQMGGNDHRHPNEIPGRDYYHAYVDLVEDIHSNWPNAIIILMSQWGGFTKEGKKYVGSTYYQEETREVNEHFKDRGFVYYFPTEGLLQHNDINPKNHLTDVGHVKIASHLLQWVKLVLRWNLEPTGEVQSGTTYWNDQQEY
ncbi:CAZyme family CE2 [Penicillium roqueforti]|nr:CAZyme family CE2 [Penicillium roqueforti]KAI2700746.1 CAZyme family CE2 [Penicillium roqueforti]KAI2712519.1 CAZyme family CE2 [Penicillium roqueforti]KAI2715301.1 CAZyme family CE2 [Penicillium roqueforti]KAI2720149.1 CAZyme family CE2 [Penicillium roqueforti]